MRTLDSIGDTVYSSGGGVGSSRGVSRRGNSIGDGREVAVSPRQFDQYPIYKDSEIEWLDKIPVHWGVKRLKFSAPLRTSKLDTKPDDKVYVGLKHVESWTGRLLLEPQPERVDGVMLSFRAGEVLLGKLRPYLAKVARPDFDGVCTSEILVLRPMPRCLQGYIMYFLLNESQVLWLNSLTYGAKMPRVSPEQVGNSLVTLPSVPEQHAIAAFLDRETTKIDGLIEQKERLIELLGEKRTALITHAVTHGLDPTAPVKDSGIEWLDKIPAHWEIKRMKHVSVVENSGEFGAEPGECAIDLPVCTTAHLTAAGVFLVDDMPVRSFSGEEASRYVGVPGDLFVVKSSGSNTNIITGKLGLVTNTTPRIVFSNFLLRIRPSAKAVFPSFLAYLLRSALTRERIRKMVATTTYPNINVSEYVGSALALPGVDEQKHIAAFLDRETAKIDGLVAKIRQAIDLLKEYRVALISAAVTGKVDVREVAA